MEGIKLPEKIFPAQPYPMRDVLLREAVAAVEKAIKEHGLDLTMQYLEDRLGRSNS